MQFLWDGDMRLIAKLYDHYNPWLQFGTISNISITLYWEWNSLSKCSNRTAAGLLSAVIPDSMSDMVDSERCLVTIRNGSPANIRRYVSLSWILMSFFLSPNISAKYGKLHTGIWVWGSHCSRITDSKSSRHWLQSLCHCRAPGRS